jgi:hypothetical protein
MQADLEKLEEAQRETQAKLAQMESKPNHSYPQLQVIDRAYPPSRPVWPDYWKDTGFALGGSVGFALALVFLYDYLTRKHPVQAAAPAIPNIQVYIAQDRLLFQGQALESTPVISADTAPFLLENQPLRELSEAELRILLEASDILAKQAIGFLLSGLSLAEIAALRQEDIDFSSHRVVFAEDGQRLVVLGERLIGWLRQVQSVPAWASAGPDIDSLQALIACAAVDAGLPEPLRIDAETLRHAYRIYLVRQGIRLSELGRVIGPLPVKTLAAYARFSPPGPGLAAEAVPLVHPVLRHQGMLADAA